MKHYKGKLGEFDYEETLWKLLPNSLRYTYEKAFFEPIEIPKGITDCTGMFMGCGKLLTVPKIPCEVTVCDYMFVDCYLLQEAPLYKKRWRAAHMLEHTKISYIQNLFSMNKPNVLSTEFVENKFKELLETHEE